MSGVRPIILHRGAILSPIPIIIALYPIFSVTIFMYVPYELINMVNLSAKGFCARKKIANFCIKLVYILINIFQYMGKSVCQLLE